MERRKRLTGTSSESCFERYRNIKDNQMFSENERMIAKMWLIDEMTPKQISRSGKVISKRNRCMSEDMIYLYIKRIFPEIEYAEKPTKSKRAHDKQHMNNAYYWQKELKGKPCAKCGAPAECVDHIIPVACGGTDKPENIQFLCKSCHKEKTQEERESGVWYSNKSTPTPCDVKTILNKQVSIFNQEV